MFSLKHTRRNFLRSSVGLAGLTLPTFFKAQAVSTPKRRKAKACIVIYTWGGMSHYESFDPKPEAPVDIRATVFKAMGINPNAELHDQLDRPYRICDGKPLPIV